MAYVYRHIRLDKNEPFYIGIGNDTYYRRSRNKSRRNNLWKKIVSKTEYEIEILFDNISYEFAQKKEIEFISLYGRINKGTGTLANLTDGGESLIGLVKTKEHIDKIRNTLKGRKLPDTHRKNISLGQIGRIHSEESKLKMSISKKGKRNLLIAGDKHINARKVLNTETNEIYSSLRIVSELYCINYSTLANQLNGNKVNKTKFVYL